MSDLIDELIARNVRGRGVVLAQDVNTGPEVDAAYKRWRRAAERGYGPTGEAHPEDMRKTDEKIRRLKARYETLRDSDHGANVPETEQDKQDEAEDAGIGEMAKQAICPSCHKGVVKPVGDGSYKCDTCGKTTSNPKWHDVELVGDVAYQVTEGEKAAEAGKAPVSPYPQGSLADKLWHQGFGDHAEYAHKYLSQDMAADLAKEPSDDDIDKAITGLGLWRQNPMTLRDIISEHSGKDQFSAKVIAAAAQKTLDQRRNAGARDDAGQQPGRCVECGQPFSASNVYTPEGWKETKISGMCEKCFDKAFGEDGASCDCNAMTVLGAKA
jgi:ribosomal protein L37AE/L43A